MLFSPKVDVAGDMPFGRPEQVLSHALGKWFLRRRPDIPNLITDGLGPS